MSLATLRARVGATAATAVLAGTALALTVPGTAHATTARVTQPARPAASSHASAGQRRAARRQAERQQHARQVTRILHVASKQKGKPYSYGGDGPRSFDCSGLVRYVFLHAVHRSLPHNAAQQYHSTVHLRRSKLQPGDLVFVDNGGYISHVGIFAGHHHWWVAPHTGTHVKLQRIYHAHLLYGRVNRIYH